MNYQQLPPVPIISFAMAPSGPNDSTAGALFNRSRAMLSKSRAAELDALLSWAVDPGGPGGPGGSLDPGVLQQGREPDPDPKNKGDFKGLELESDWNNDFPT